MAVIFNKKLPHQLQQTRSFLEARVKWVRDPYLDHAVLREKNLQQIISLKNQIISSPSKSVPLSTISLLKPQFNLPTTAAKMFRKYPSVFSQFQPGPSRPIHVKLTPQTETLHNEEQTIHSSRTHRNDAVNRLAKLLMLTRSGKLPLHVVNRFSFDLGLPHNYVTSLLADYPDYFQVREIEDVVNGGNTLGLEILSWRNDLAVSEMEKREGNNGLKKGLPIRYSMKLPDGFDLKKRIRDWVEKWQELPYISPYEHAFHLGETSDQAEKWTVGVLHELLWLLVSKKIEKENVVCLGDYLGFGLRFKKALIHHPGIFYVSNKIRTQTVVLREAYKKDVLMEKHPLMGMRHRYIYLMSKPGRRVNMVRGSRVGIRRKVSLCMDGGKKDTR